MNSGTTQVLNLVIGIFLARLLSPEDYGIVGVLTIFTAIAGNLQSSGFTQGLINLKTPTDRDYNSVFSFNVCMSAVMYTILFFSAPLIARFFHQDCLVGVSRFVFLGFFIAAISIAHGGYLTKNMMNKEIAIIGAVALVVSGVVGIVTALMGMAYWALAWQQVTYIACTTLGRYYFVRGWHAKLTLDFGPVRHMAAFSLKILVTNIVNTISMNILTVIFGRLFPMRQVGNYSQAFKWDTMAHSLVTNTIGQIAQAVLVEADDTHELTVYRKMMRFTAFLTMPLMFGLTLISREFIILTIGEAWIDCVPLLQVLCISGAFMPIYTMYQNLAISKGRSDIFMWLNLVQVVLQMILILLLHSYGMLVMVCAYSLFMILWLLPWHLYTGKLIGYRWWDAFKDVAPFTFVASVVMGVTGIATSGIDSVWLQLMARVGLAAVLYYAVMKMLHVQILCECERFFSHYLGRLR